MDGLSLDLRRGETLGLVGESGSGKTTFGQALIRLIKNDGGRITFLGDRIEDKDRRHEALPVPDADRLPGPVLVA